MDADEVITVEEMKARYAPEWVLIGDPEIDEHQRVTAGKVLFHSRNREEVYQKAIELQPKHSAFRFLGTIPDDMVFVL